MNRPDHLELVHVREIDEAMRRLDQAVAEARRCTTVPPAWQTDGTPRAGERIIEDIYRTAAGIRLDLIYSTAIGGELRKRWANRMGEINLRAPAAVGDINALLAELAAHQTNINGALDFAIGQVARELRRLRALCARHAEQSGA